MTTDRPRLQRPGESPRGATLATAGLRVGVEGLVAVAATVLGMACAVSYVPGAYGQEAVADDPEVEAAAVVRELATVTAVWTQPDPEDLRYWTVYGAAESDGRRKRVSHVRYKRPHRLVCSRLTDKGLFPIVLATDENSAFFADARNPYRRRVGRALSVSYLRGTRMDLVLDQICASPERFQMKVLRRPRTGAEEPVVLEVTGGGLWEVVGLGADSSQSSGPATRVCLHVDPRRYVPLREEVWNESGLHATWIFSDYVSVGKCLAPRLIVWRCAEPIFSKTWEFRLQFQVIADAVWLLKRAENVHDGQAVRYLQVFAVSLEPIPESTFVVPEGLHRLTGREIEEARREAVRTAKRVHCRSRLKNFALASRMYSGDNGKCFPDDLSVLYTGDYMTAFQMWTCPATTTTPPASLENIRSGQHCDYLYFGGGLTEDCAGGDPAKTVLGCDKPGNHEAFLNVWLANGSVKGYEGSSIEEVVDRNGLFLPGYNTPEKENAQVGAAPD